MHLLIAETLTAKGTVGFFLRSAMGRRSMCVSGSWGVYERVCLHTTHRDSAARQILPGHLWLWSAQEVPHPPLSQDLRFLSGPGWVSNLLIAAVTTEWRACESGNQLPRRVFPPHLSSTCLTLWILCVCVFADTAHHLLLGFSEPLADPTKHLLSYEKNSRLNFLHGYSRNLATECNIALLTIFIICPFPLLTV